MEFDDNGTIEKISPKISEIQNSKINSNDFSYESYLNS